MIYRCSLRNRLSRAALLLVVTVSAAAAQDEQAASNEADNKVRLRQAEDFVGRMEVHLSTGGDVVARVDRPLQFYADSARKSSDGSLWAWGTTGRPLLIIWRFFATPTGREPARSHSPPRSALY